MTAPRPVTPVGILAGVLERAEQQLRLLAEAGPTDALAEVLADVGLASALAGGLDPYVEACSTPQSDALAALAQRTQAEDWGSYSGGGAVAPLEQEMLSGHLEGRLLGFLVRLTRARRVLEVGLFTGYSALAMAEALPADGSVVACEIDPDVADFARRCLKESPAGDKVTVRVGPAAATLAELSAAGEAFELVFIDADKAGYAGYLDQVLDGGLLAPDGLVAVDNTLMQGQPWLPGPGTANGAAIAAFNAAVAADPRVEQVLLPVRDGLTLIRRV